MVGLRHLVVCAAVVGLCAAARAQSAQQIVRDAVGTELYAAAHDHTHWMYYEVDSKPGSVVKQWVAETRGGSLKLVMEKNGQRWSRQQQRSSMEAFIDNPAAQAKARKGGQHDDQQAAQMLNMLPQAFIWTIAARRDGNTVLNFRPNPQFTPPTWESRVFAAMGGEITVNDAEHRIVSLKGRLLSDVKFWGGLLGDLQAGGSFDVERRQLPNGDWQIMDTHVHIQGHALIFKDISEQEDDVLTKFSELPANITFEEAEKDLLEQKQ
ncbi:MAG: hypothetical protein ACRD19_14655 [Terriglobia bacterium]